DLQELGVDECVHVGEAFPHAPDSPLGGTVVNVDRGRVVGLSLLCDTYIQECPVDVDAIGNDYGPNGFQLVRAVAPKLVSGIADGDPSSRIDELAQEIPGLLACLILARGYIQPGQSYRPAHAVGDQGDRKS